MVAGKAALDSEVEVEEAASIPRCLGSRSWCTGQEVEERGLVMAARGSAAEGKVVMAGFEPVAGKGEQVGKGEPVA